MDFWHQMKLAIRMAGDTGHLEQSAQDVLHCMTYMAVNTSSYNYALDTTNSQLI